jgi:hypothetical protein
MEQPEIGDYEDLLPPDGDFEDGNLNGTINSGN